MASRMMSIKWSGSPLLRAPLCPSIRGKNPSTLSVGIESVQTSTQTWLHFNTNPQLVDINYHHHHNHRIQNVPFTSLIRSAAAIDAHGVTALDAASVQGLSSDSVIRSHIFPSGAITPSMLLSRSIASSAAASSCFMSTVGSKSINNISIRTMSATNNTPFLTSENINENVKKMEYAVRGPLVIRAGVIEKELKAGAKKPFTQVIRANIGDCHAMGQLPITFIRQVLACVSDPSLIESGPYPADVKARAHELLTATGAGHSVGCYSDSAGVELIRRHCAAFITARDGYPSNWEDIILTTGASDGVRSVLSLLNSSVQDGIPSGVLIPIPQYPLYTATLAEYGMRGINYYLDEGNEWALQMDELEKSLESARDECKPKAIVIINPGNPTGSVLTKENIIQVIEFAVRHELMIIADEVYQHNIYREGAQFHSFKSVMMEMGVTIELASLMSASKGYMGECGLRGGYTEIINLDPTVKALYLKMLSARLCCSVLGQVAMDCIVAAPQPGDPSYELHEKEKGDVLRSLKDRAKLVAETFNSIPGMRSNEVAGAMYAFPEITLSPKAIAAAEAKGQAADFFYAMELLETTGICIIPGSGFGQIPGTYHFRTTILPQTDKLEDMMAKLREFHVSFTQRYQ